MKKLLNIFFNLKLKSKLLISYIIIILVSTFMVSFFFFKIYESDSIQKSVTLSQSMVEQLAANVAYKTKNLDDTIFLNVKMAEIFSDNMQTNDYLHVVRNASVPALVDSISSLDVDIKEIFLETSSNETFYYNREEPSDTEFNDKLIYQYIKENYDMIKNKSGQSIWIAFPDNINTIYIFRSVIDSTTLDFKGILGLAIDNGYLAGQYSVFDEKDNGSIIIYNGDHSIIYCNQDIIPLAEEIKSYLPKTSANAIQEQVYGNKRYIITGSVSSNNKWKVLYVIPSETLLQGSSKIKLSILIICLISTAIAMFIALVISGSITSNVRMLLKKIKSVERGEFSMQLEPVYHDEIGQLFQEFNVMSGKLNELIKRIAFEQVEKQKAEYNALLAQINPHFLYNALESINSFAKLHGQDEIVKIINSLSHLLRVSIKGNKSVITLRAEIEYVQHYLSIYKIILADRVQVDYFIDQDVMDCEVPKLILQPIVENAIVHGIEKLNNGGSIVVSAYEDGSNVSIKVADNGMGMGEETINSLMAESTESDEQLAKHTHIGVRSVNRRIKILYGEDYGLKINSEPGIGTVIELNIPLKRIEGSA